MTDKPISGLISLKIVVEKGKAKIFAIVDQKGIPLLKAKLDIVDTLLVSDKEP